jgi:hypothetical protein
MRGIGASYDVEMLKLFGSGMMEKIGSLKGIKRGWGYAIPRALGIATMPLYV